MNCHSRCSNVSSLLLHVELAVACEGDTVVDTCGANEDKRLQLVPNVMAENTILHGFKTVARVWLQLLSCS